MGILLFILVNAFNCRFQIWTADAFTRYTFRPAIVFVHEYKLCKATGVMYNDEGDAEQSEYTGAEEID